LVLLSVICVAGLSAAIVAVMRWGRLETTPAPLPMTERALPAAAVLVRYARALCVAVVAGGTAGALVGGLGGRLAMRIIAATSSDQAQGSITEAEEVVGKITLEGTLGLVIFVGIAGGAIMAVFYLLVRRWLPGPAWLSGLLFGMLLLAVFGRIDPVDPNNPDFVLVGPAWLAALVFTVLVPLYGLVLGPMVARLDASYPVLSRRPKAIAAHAPLLLFVPLGPALVVVAAGAAVAVGLQRIRPLTRAWRSAFADSFGRVVLGVTGVVGLAFTGAGLVDIIG
jgi:hypothetical protein